MPNNVDCKISYSYEGGIIGYVEFGSRDVGNRNCNTAMMIRYFEDTGVALSALYRFLMTDAISCHCENGSWTFKFSRD